MITWQNWGKVVANKGEKIANFVNLFTNKGNPWGVFAYCSVANLNIRALTLQIGPFNGESLTKANGI